ncbi:hypothetical protein HDU93_005664, partial [Gonapodya sp. JEL0774]
MSSLFNTISGFFGGASEEKKVPDSAFPPELQFAPDECADCPVDCDEKLKIPADIAKHIDYKDSIVNSVK